jgi:archaemetzincin
MKYFYVGVTSDGEQSVPREALELVRDRVAAQFAVPVREIGLPAADFAFDPRRGQYSSIAVLEMLLGQAPEDACKLLALTGRDLFIPVLTFVYGQAQFGGRVAVVSTARLRQEFYGMPGNRAAFLERTAKEGLHEAGHTFGLVHCADRSCVMSLATNIRQLDFKKAEFCALCAARLRHYPRESS